MPWRLTGPQGPVSIDQPSRVRTNSSEVVRELVISGLGIGLRSLWDVGEELGDGRLVRVLSGYRGTADVGIFAISAGGVRRTAGSRAFVEHLQVCWSGGFHAEPPGGL